jgi:hypothetical protein
MEPSFLNTAEELNDVSAAYNVEVGGVPLRQKTTAELTKANPHSRLLSLTPEEVETDTYKKRRLES